MGKAHPDVAPRRMPAVCVRVSSGGGGYNPSGMDSCPAVSADALIPGDDGRWDATAGRAP
ncbi:hypothetical protein Are01nite_81280 [Actinoplanes regularis]|nr:hypothetical protein Are01nite_81280 [Actinoplanes regularis]